MTEIYLSSINDCYPENTKDSRIWGGRLGSYLSCVIFGEGSQGGLL